MIWDLVFSEEFMNDIRKHQKSGNKILLRKIDTLLSEIRNHLTDGTGKPE